jgi:uncharacterized protein
MTKTRITTEMMTKVSRRQLMAGAAAAGTAAMLPRLTRAATGSGASQLYLSARADTSGGFRATGLRETGDLVFDVTMPARGHSMAMRPGVAEAVFFGRRPGAFAMVVDVVAGRQARIVDAAPGRWFNGHGVFTPAGDRLFASETVADTGDGVIGIYDPAAGYRRVGEWRSGGLDPHDLRLLSDGRTLVVPNGGILQIDSVSRAKLNIRTMAPSLDYLDMRTGAVLAKVALPPKLHQLSIRHLSVAPGDRVAIAMQYEGSFGDRVPLVGLHEPGAASIRLIGPPQEAVRKLRQYCGSAATDASGRILGVTSPRGGVTAFWDLPAGRFLGFHALADCCGIAPMADEGQFLISNGSGVLRHFDAAAMKEGALADVTVAGAEWDNHMLVTRFGDA